MSSQSFSDTITQTVPILDTGKSFRLTLVFRYGFNCLEYEVCSLIIKLTAQKQWNKSSQMKAVASLTDKDIIKHDFLAGS